MASRFSVRYSSSSHDAEEFDSFADSFRVLLIGAGGIGCEQLKNIALFGFFRRLTIIDLDSVDVSNLNRQFLFRREHVGKPKAKCAAEVAMKMNPRMEIEPIVGDVTKCSTFGLEFWDSFDLVVNALDNENARRYVNRICIMRNKPLLEAGSTGYAGQAYPIIKGETECYECDAPPAPKAFAVCTIRSAPTEPQHTIAWAKLVLEILYGSVDNGAADADKPLISRDDVNDMETELREIRATTSRAERPLAMARKLFVEDIKPMAAKWTAASSSAKPEPLDVEGIEAISGEVDVGIMRPSASVAEDVGLFLGCVANLEDASKDGTIAVHFDKADSLTMGFVHAAANCRNRIFSLPVNSRWRSESIAGLIIPAIASTNAVVAGCQANILMLLLEELFARSKGLSSVVTKTNSVGCNWIKLTSGGQERRVVERQRLQEPSPMCVGCSSNPDTIEVELYDFDSWSLHAFIKVVLKGELNINLPMVELDGSVAFDPEEESASYISSRATASLVSCFVADGVTHSAEVADLAIPGMEFLLNIRENMDLDSVNYPHKFRVVKNTVATPASDEWVEPPTKRVLRVSEELNCDIEHELSSDIEVVM